MRVVRRVVLEEFAREHADIRAQLDAWLSEVKEANWQSPNDIKVRFPSASFFRDNRVVFNLKGKRYRLDTTISYKHKTVYIERIGTHAEYSKWQF